MDWHHLFEMKTGRKLTDTEAADWSRELNHDLDRNQPGNDEIRNAIRWAFSDRNIKQFTKRSKYDYDQPYLRMIICLWRKERSESGVGKSDKLDEYRRKIRMTNDDYEIWEVVCTPIKSDDCEILERYAASVHKGWSRPKERTICDAF